MAARPHLITEIEAELAGCAVMANPDHVILVEPSGCGVITSLWAAAVVPSLNVAVPGASMKPLGSRSEIDPDTA